MDGQRLAERVLLAVAIALLMLAPLLDIPIAVAALVLLAVLALSLVHASGGRSRPR